MNGRFARSEAGREEIKSRNRKLSRPARNLLLVMDGSRPVSDWIQLVHAATEADLQQLLAEGLIEPAAAGTPMRASTRASLAEALKQLNYDQLYNLVTSQAKERLGLFRGYMMVLDVEKCANVDELRAVAVRFLDLVKEYQGENAARQMRLALGAAT
jgi:hypothetical protein